MWFTVAMARLKLIDFKIKNTNNVFFLSYILCFLEFTYLQLCLLYICRCYWTLPRTTHGAGLEAFPKNTQWMKQIHLRYILRIQYGWQILFWKKCFFELNGDVKQSRTTIGTKFVPPNNCIFMDEVDIKCLEIRNRNLSFDSAMLTIYYSVLLTEKRAHTASQWI